jgi:exopolysaccharide production protein ExoQ
MAVAPLTPAPRRPARSGWSEVANLSAVATPLGHEQDRRALAAFRIQAATYVIAVAIFMLMPIQMAAGGTMRVAAELALLAVVMGLRPVEAGRSVIVCFPLLLFPLFAICSTFWSIGPAASLRYSLQLAITAYIGIHFARLLGPRRLVAALFTALFLFCALSIASGRKGVSAEGMVLIGLSGSKNQIAGIGSLLLALSMAMLLDRTQMRQLRLAALGAIPMAVFLVHGANSTSALITAIVGVVIMLVLSMLQRVGPRGRVALLGAALVCTAPLAAVAPEGEKFVSDFTQNVLHKDATLTGRTLLWQRADELIRDRPILGYGYSAVWLDEGPIGTGLRGFADQSDGRAFHFHHSYRQVTVDTGFVGLFFFVLTLAAIGMGVARRAIMHPTIAMSLFTTAFILTIALSFTELIVATYSITYVVLLATGVFAFARPPQPVHPPEQHPLLELRC